LQPTAAQQSGCLLLFFAVVWNGITYVVGGVMLYSGDVPWFGLAFMGLFAAVGLLVMIAAVKKLMAEAKLHPPEVTVSAQPLHLGEEFSGQFNQVAKSQATINNVSIKLVCRESATYRRGTDTTTVTHDVFSEEFTLSDLQDADALTGLKGDFHFRIPEDAMHSFTGNRNTIQWILETHTDVAGWPDYTCSLLLQVAPQRIAPRKT
jgi:hypothetical protein